MSCVYVVDDESDLVWSLEKSLSHKGYQVVTASDGVEALRLMHRCRPNVVVLDVMMPQMDGIELCRRMRSDPMLSRVPILFLTIKQAIEDKLEGFGAGCDDYLTKPFDLRELKVRVEALLGRSRLPILEAPVDRLTVGSLSLDLRTFSVTTDSRTVLLTPRQFELLYHLMAHPGEVFSSQRLLREVFGHPPGGGDPATVRWHVKRLREKVEPSPSDPIYIRTIPRWGYTVAQSLPDGGSHFSDSAPVPKTRGR